MRNLGNISELYEQVKDNSLNRAIQNIVEKLGKNADMGDYIDDFQKSDAPQFKGASKEKRREMAIAAFLDQKDKKEGFASDAQRRAAFAQGYKAKGKKGKKEEVEEEINIQEDGHVDVASAVRQCKTISEDAMQMLQKLQTMSPEDALPTWWTNKLAVASNNMNKMRDYLLVPSVSEETELNEAEVSVYGFISTGARKTFLDDLKSMRLQFKSKVFNLPQPAPPSGVLKFDANQSTIEAIIKFAKRRKLKIMEGKIDEETKDLQDNFSPSMIDKLRKAYEPLKGKKINPDPLMKIFDKIDSNKNGLIQLYKADIPFVSTMAFSRLRLKHNMKDDEVKKLREEVELSETIVDFDYSRNPKAIFNAFLQMSRRLNLTLFNAPTGMKDLQSKGTGRIGGTKQNMLKFMKYLNSKGIEPKVEIINEQSSDFFKKARMKAGLPPTPTARSAAGYELFHKTFSGAMQHAYAMAKKNMRMTVDPKEIDSKVATGPKKPGVGKTNRYSLKTNNGILQIQVYNRGGSKPFELNMYQG